METLSPRELEVVERIGKGMTNDEIAAELFVSRNTVKTHVQHIFQKLGCKRRGEVIRLVVQAG